MQAKKTVTVVIQFGINNYIFYNGITDYTENFGGSTRITGEVFMFNLDNKENKKIFTTQNGPIKLISIDKNKSELIILNSDKLFMFEIADGIKILNEFEILDHDYPNNNSALDAKSWLDAGSTYYAKIEDNKNEVLYEHLEREKFKFSFVYDKNKKSIRYMVVKY